MADEIHRYKVGDIEVTVLTDGFRDVPVDGKYLSNASAEDLAAQLKAEGRPTDTMRNTYAPIVLKTGGKPCCSTPATARPRSRRARASAALLNQNLAAAGIDRNTIDVVVISHFHADHVNGLLAGRQQDRRSRTPRSRCPAVEWKFWMDDGEKSRASPGRMTELFQNNRRVFDALGRKVTPYDWDKEVVPGVTAVGTPGHSIGHTSYRRRVRRQDASMCSPTSATTPSCSRRVRTGRASSTRIRPQAAATRKRVYDMLVAEKLPVQAYHFPFPALRGSRRSGGGYRTVPIAGL